MRARLHQVEQRVRAGPRAHQRSHSEALRERRNARHRCLQQVFRLDLSQPAHRRRRVVVAPAAGAVVSGSSRLSGPRARVLRCADLLHLSLRADRARRGHRPREKRPRADGSRRAGHPSRHLQADVSEGACDRVQHRSRKSLSQGHLRDPRAGRGDGGLRRRPSRAARRTTGQRSRVLPATWAEPAVPDLWRAHRPWQGLR